MPSKGTKKKVKLTLKYDILKFDKNDCRQANEFFASHRDLAKIVKPLEFKVDAELDDRKWDAKKLEDVGYYGDKGGVFGIRMSVKLFDMACAEAKKKNRPDDVKKAYAELEKDSSYAFEKLMKEIESGKADNAAALKEGKAAMDKLKDVKFDKAFNGKQKECSDALKAVLKGGEVDKKKLEAAKTALTKIQSELAESVGSAETAIKFLLDIAKKTEKDKSADESLQEFGATIRKKHSKTFQSFTKGCEDFDEAMDEALEILGKEPDAKAINDLMKKFDTIKGLDAADDCQKIVDELRPEFKDIEKELK